MTPLSTLSAPVGYRPAVFRIMATAVLAAGAWALSVGASTAQARDVYWSVGVNSPGVSVGVSNAPPVYYQPPAVVYHRPPPVVYQTAPTVIYQPPVVVHRPYPSRHVQPVVVVQGPVLAYPGLDDRRYRHERRDRQDWHDRKDRYQRHDRDDRRERRSDNHRRSHDDRRGYAYR